MRAARTFRETTPQEKERARQTPGRKNHEEIRNGKGEDARLPGESRSEGQGVRREPQRLGRGRTFPGQEGARLRLAADGEFICTEVRRCRGCPAPAQGCFSCGCGSGSSVLP